MLNATISSLLVKINVMQYGILLKLIFFNDRLMDDEASTFEDIVDAYLAYLQVNFTKREHFYTISYRLQFVRTDSYTLT